MYGGGTKPESYCKISVYIQHHAPTLYDNINDLCLFGAFGVRGNRGVTLLLPDTKSQKKIDTLVGTDSRKALDQIQACILPVFMNKISDFKKGADIPNKLGNKLSISDVGSTSVTLSNGAVIKEDPKFKRLHADGRYAVFRLEGGLVPTTGEASKALMKKRDANGGLDGGSCGQDHFVGGSDATLVGYELNKFTDHAWLTVVRGLAVRTKFMMSTRGSQNATLPDPCSLMTVSFMNYLKKSEKHSGLYRLLCAVFPISPLTFLHIGYLVSAEDRKEWVDTVDTSYNKIEELSAIVAAGTLSSENINHKKSVIRSFSGPTAGSDALKCSQTFVRTLSEDAKHASTMETYFGGVSGFAEWYLSSWEYLEKLTVPYMNALKNYGSNPSQSESEISSVFKAHELFVANNGVNKQFSAMRLLTRDRSDMPIQLFCAIITLVMGDFGTSGGDLSAMGGVSGGSEVDKLPPNSILPHSFAPAVASWWLKTLE
jgi:hypothetical protein